MFNKDNNGVSYAILEELNLYLSSGYSILDSLLFIRRLNPKLAPYVDECITKLEAGFDVRSAFLNCKCLTEEAKHYLSLIGYVDAEVSVTHALTSVKLAIKNKNRYLLTLKLRIHGFLASILFLYFILNSIHRDMTSQFIEQLPSVMYAFLKCQQYVDNYLFLTIISLSIIFFLVNKLSLVYKKRLKLYIFKKRFEQFNSLLILNETTDIGVSIAHLRSFPLVNKDSEMSEAWKIVRQGLPLDQAFKMFHSEGLPSFDNVDKLNDLKPLLRVVANLCKKKVDQEEEKMNSILDSALFCLSIIFLVTGTYFFYYCYITNILNLM